MKKEILLLGLFCPARLWAADFEIGFVQNFFDAPDLGLDMNLSFSGGISSIEQSKLFDQLDSYRALRISFADKEDKVTGQLQTLHLEQAWQYPLFKMEEDSIAVAFRAGFGVRLLQLAVRNHSEEAEATDSYLWNSSFDGLVGVNFSKSVGSFTTGTLINYVGRLYSKPWKNLESERIDDSGIVGNAVSIMFTIAYQPQT